MPASPCHASAFQQLAICKQLATHSAQPSAATVATYTIMAWWELLNACMLLGTATRLGAQVQPWYVRSCRCWRLRVQRLYPLQHARACTRWSYRWLYRGTASHAYCAGQTHRPTRQGGTTRAADVHACQWCYVLRNTYTQHPTPKACSIMLRLPRCVGCWLLLMAAGHVPARGAHAARCTQHDPGGTLRG